MNHKKYSQIKLLDCSIRDGGHINNWEFEDDFISRYLETAIESNVDIIEIGYRSNLNLSPNGGDWKYSSEDKLKEMIKNKKNSKIAVMVDIGKFYPEDFNKRSDSLVDMVRIAFYKKDLDTALGLERKIREKGYETTFNLMGICEYSNKEIKETIKSIKDTEVDIVYIADSFGSMYPEDVKKLVSKFKKGLKQKIGFHPHNNLQLAFPNTIAAMDAGAEYVDATVNGLGRGAGNLPLEIISPFLNKARERYNLVPLLNFIEGPIRGIKKKLVWGYSLPFILSGFKSCHPNYALTLDKRGYPIKDIFSILNLIDTEKSSGFKQEVLEDAIKKFDIPRVAPITSGKDLPKITAILPCHSGSQRIKNKNTKNFAGSSLTEIKLHQLINSKEISEVLVFTDDLGVKQIISKDYHPKIKIIEDKRPAGISTNDELISHIAEKISNEEGHILWTHVTSPFIDEETYSRAITQYLSDPSPDKSLVSVKEMKEYIWDANKNPVSYNSSKKGLWPKTQEIEPLYMINSGIFLIPRDIFKKTKKRTTSNLQYFKCSEIESSDIDWEYDFERAQLLWRAMEEFEAKKILFKGNELKI